MNAVAEVLGLWWVGALVACGLGLLSSRLQRGPAHRIAWMRWSILGLGAWAIAAAVPFERPSIDFGRRSAVSSSAEQDATPHFDLLRAPGRVPTPTSRTPETLQFETGPAETSAVPSADRLAVPPVDRVVVDQTTGRAFERLPTTQPNPTVSSPTDTGTQSADLHSPVSAHDRPHHRLVARWVAIVWLGGSALLVAWLILGRIRIHRILRRCRRATTSESSHWLPALGVDRRAPRLLIADDEINPFCIGLIRPTIVLPGSLARSEFAAARNAVLRHELAHLSHRDPWTVTCANLTWVAFWPQPLIWLLRRVLVREIEHRADQRAATDLGRRAYATALIDLRSQLLPRTTPAALSMARHPSVFLTRMETLMKTPLPNRLTPRLTTRIARSSTAVAVCVAAITAFGRDLPAQDPERVQRLEDRISVVEDRLGGIEDRLDAVMKMLMRRIDPPGDAPGEPRADRDAAASAGGGAWAQFVERTNRPTSLDPIALGVQHLEVQNRLEQMQVRLERLAQAVDMGASSSLELQEAEIERQGLVRLSDYLEQALRGAASNVEMKLRLQRQKLEQSEALFQQGLVPKTQLDSDRQKAAELESTLHQIMSSPIMSTPGGGQSSQPVTATGAAGSGAGGDLRLVGTVVHLEKADDHVEVVIDVPQSFKSLPESGPKMRVKGNPLATGGGKPLKLVDGSITFEHTRFGWIGTFRLPVDSVIQDGDRVYTRLEPLLPFDTESKKNEADAFFVGRDRDPETTEAAAGSSSGGGSGRRR